MIAQNTPKVNWQNKATVQIHHAPQGKITLTAAGAPIPNLLPQDWANIYANMQCLKLIGRSRCPGCGQWFANPTHFGIYQPVDSEDIYTYATCQACTSKGMATEAARAALLDRVAAFFEGGAQ